MEKRVGTGFPEFACEITKYRDVYNCIRDPIICSNKTWLNNRYKKCLATETEKQGGRKAPSKAASSAKKEEKPVARVIEEPVAL